MAERDRIRTPLKLQWRRVRHQLIPVATFGISVLLVTWLWGRHFGAPAVTGEVRLVQTIIASPEPGVLIGLPGRELESFDFVEQGQVIARLDDRPLRARLAEIGTVASRLRAEAAGSLSPADSLRLDAVEHRARLEALRMELQRERLHTRRQALEQLVKNEEAELAGIQQKLQQLSTDVASGVSARDDSALGFSITAQETAIDEILLKAGNLELRAPISGVVSDVQRVPGQAVIAGEPIATITKPTSRYIVSYIRQDQRVRPAADDEVNVRRRHNGGRGLAARVARVGQHLELIPQHQLRDPNTPEWGLPVLIELPTTMDAVPGELVDIRFVSVTGS